MKKQVFSKAIRSSLSATALLLLCGTLQIESSAAPEFATTFKANGLHQPQIAVANDGNTIYLAAANESGAYCLKSTDGGKSFEKPVTAISLPGMPLGKRRGPRISCTDDSIVMTVTYDDVYAVRSTDGGKSWSKAVKLNSSARSAEEGLHGMSALPDGTVFVVWQDGRNGNQIWGARSNDGGATWSKDEKIYASPSGTVCACCHPSVALGSDHSINVMFRNSKNGSRDLYLAIRKAKDKSFGDALKLGDESWQLNACPMDGGSLALAANGDVATAWQSKGSVYRCTLSHDKKVQTEKLGEGKQPVVFWDKKEPVEIWQNGKDLVMKRGTKPSFVLGEGSFPSVASMPKSQKVFLAWESPDNKSIEVAVLNNRSK